MRLITATALALTLSFCASAHAESMNKGQPGSKENAPGTTGAMGNVNANGVATDPGGVKAQQGDTSKAAPGTVGAAPGTTPSNTQKK